jgi:ABC-2 type transport system permease protein
MIGERAGKTREMPAQDRWAWTRAAGASIRAAWAQIKVTLQYQFTYPHDMITDLLQMFLQMLVFREVWIALYAGRKAHAGVTLAQAVTYQLVNVIVVRLFSTWVLYSANHRIRTGDIIFQITRPTYYGHILLFEYIGQAGTKLVTTSLPMFGVACLLFRPALPSSASVWLSFGVSLGLGFLTAFYLDYILALIGFWTTELGGLFWAKESIIMILGGSYLPLWIYPPLLRQILAFLPFQGLSYTPVAIFVGQIGLSQVPRAFVVQIAWLVILAAASRRLYVAAMVKLAVQGG